MTSNGHRLTGLAAGIVAAAVVSLYGGMPYAALVAGLIGGTAPDDLEIWRKVKDSKGTYLGSSPLIKHRTITHLVPLWVLLVGLSSMKLGDGLLWDALFGYACGGLMHLIVDFPNPVGVPFINPQVRYSLGWWRSGSYEPLIVVFTMFIAFSFASSVGWSPL